VTPGPIPNPVVTASSADGTAPEGVWESRTPPNIEQQRAGPRTRRCGAPPRSAHPWLLAAGLRPRHHDRVRPPRPTPAEPGPEHPHTRIPPHGGVNPRPGRIAPSPPSVPVVGAILPARRGLGVDRGARRGQT